MLSLVRRGLIIDNNIIQMVRKVSSMHDRYEVILEKILAKENFMINEVENVATVIENQRAASQGGIRSIAPHQQPKLTERSTTCDLPPIRADGRIPREESLLEETEGETELARLARLDPEESKERESTPRTANPP